MSEIVYIFANPAMPDYIKIGRTSRDEVEKRLKELSNPSGVPVPFECLYAVEVADAKKVEDAIHEAFDCDRPNKRREFFTTASDRIMTLLDAFAISPDESDSIQEEFDKNTDTEDKLAQTRVAEASERRSNLKFSEIGIQPGAELAFLKDGTKKCKVVDDKKVEYNGKITSLSKLAVQLLQEVGINRPSATAQGAYWFTYEGERLTTRRDRLERESEI